MTHFCKRTMFNPRSHVKQEGPVDSFAKPRVNQIFLDSPSWLKTGSHKMIFLRYTQSQKPLTRKCWTLDPTP